MKEFMRKHVTLPPITWTTRGNHVPGRVHTAFRDWKDVVQCRYLGMEADAAIHAAVGAVP